MLQIYIPDGIDDFKAHLHLQARMFSEIKFFMIWQT